VSEDVLPEEFGAFFRRTHARMLTRAIMFCGNSEDAEDALQEAYFEASRRWETLRNYDSPEGWLGTVMIQRLLKVRKRWFRENATQKALPPPLQQGPDETVAILLLLDALPPMQRKTVILSYYGMKQEEIGQLLHIRRGTVASHLHNARQALARTLRPVTVTRHGPQEFITAGRLSPQVPHDPVARALRDTEAWTRALHDTEAWICQAVEADREGRDRLWNQLCSRLPGLRP
jgi:RNA polymerase sigma factor (sigma-70 family)